MDRKILTYKQTADLMSISLGTLYALVSQNRIPHLRFGKRFIRFDEEIILKWIQSKSQDVKTLSIESEKNI